MIVPSLVAYLLLFLACLAVGVRLILLWRRTGELPELLIGVGFLCSGVLGNGLGVLRASIPDSLFSNVFFISVARGCYAVGSLCILITVWRIFRRTSAWAVVLVAVDSVLLVLYTFRTSLLSGISDWQSHPLFLSGVLGVTFPYLWMTVESFRYQALVRRRYRLGLPASVATATRLLFWGLAVASVSIAFTVFELSPVFGLGLSTVLLSMTVFGLLGALGFWLAFFTPRPIRRWIEQAAPGQV